jgi:hypothetical protein
MELENSTENGPGGVRVGQISKVPLPQPGFQFYCVLRRGGRSRTSESNTARETATCRSSTQSSWSWPMSVSVGARRRSAYHTRTAVAEREEVVLCLTCRAVAGKGTQRLELAASKRRSALGDARHGTGGWPPWPRACAPSLSLSSIGRDGRGTGRAK